MYCGCLYIILDNILPLGIETQLVYIPGPRVLLKIHIFIYRYLQYDIINSHKTFIKKIRPLPCVNMQRPTYHDNSD